MRMATVRPDFIQTVTESRCFRQAQSRTGTVTRRTGHGTGFTVMKKYSCDGFGIPWVEEGGFTGLLSDERQNLLPINRRKQEEILNDAFPVLNIHFHPRYDEPVSPSFGDLFAILQGFTYDEYDGKGYEVRTIEGIAQIDPTTGVEVLLIQPLMPFFPGEDEQAIVERLERAASTEEVARTLIDSGACNAEVVRFHKWVLRDQDGEKLRKFAFTPRPVQTLPWGIQPLQTVWPW